MRRAIVAGHVCADLIPGLAGGERIEPGALVEVGALDIRPGGCVANTGDDLAALGVPVRLVADVGADELGRVLARMLDAGRVQGNAIRLLAEATTSYSLVFQPRGEDRSFWHHVGANGCFDGTGVDPSDADLVHVGYPPLLPALYAEQGAGLLGLLVRVRRAGASTSVDLATVDPASPAARVDWPAVLAAALPVTDVFTPSVDDLVSTLGVPRPGNPGELQALARRMLDLGAAVVLVTDGPRGLALCTGRANRLATAGRALGAQAGRWADHEMFIPAGPAAAVRTTGAGDAATAGLLHGILTAADPRSAAHTAAVAASLRVSGWAQLPRYDTFAGYQPTPRFADRPGVKSSPADPASADAAGCRPGSESARPDRAGTYHHAGSQM